MSTPPEYVIIQTATSLISLISSTLMIGSIAWFGIDDATPYRRIILGLSISDIFQSLATLIGPSAVPLDKMSWEAKNEATSCQANGFVLQVGAIAVMLHTVFLCFYYLCKLKYRMGDEAFKNRFEGKIRAFIGLFSLISGIVPLAMDAYHISGIFHSFCSIALVPTGCWKEPDVVGECDAAHRKKFYILTGFLINGPTILSFVLIVVMMGMLYNHALVQNKYIEREVSIPTSLRGEDKASNELEDVADNKEEDEEIESPQDRVQTLSRLYRKEMTIQATLYVGAFFLMYSPFLIGSLGKPTKFMRVLMLIFYPLGGFLNILIYTRPKVAYVRRSYPECSRLRGFWLVLRAGGEIPQDVDLSVPCYHGCCGPPAWMESEYEHTNRSGANSNNSRHDEHDLRASFGIRLSRIGF